MLKHLKASDEWTEKTVLEKGFTLIELLVVIIILGILAAVVIFAVGKTRDNAKVSACKTEKKTLITAVAAFKTADANSNAPTSLASLQPDYLDTQSDINYFDVNGTGDVVTKAGVTLPSGC